ncbi:MAG: class I SAM-dependent methyltransferase [Candidatus Dormibacteria bacterium]
MPKPSAGFQPHPLFAWAYTRFGSASNRRGAQDHRQRLLAGLRGAIVEIGAGNGLNFPHYPTTVTEVIATEPEPYLRCEAELVARSHRMVRVIDARAEAIPAGRGSFDGAVTSLVLCSVTSPAVALAELKRVVRPGGELRFYEHVASHHSGLARIEGFATPVWKHLAAGCHLNRDTLHEIEAAGFVIEQVARFPFAPVPYLPAVDHILGRARRP